MNRPDILRPRKRNVIIGVLALTGGGLVACGDSPASVELCSGSNGNTLNVSHYTGNSGVIKVGDASVYPLGKGISVIVPYNSFDTLKPKTPFSLGLDDSGDIVANSVGKGPEAIELTDAEARFTISLHSGALTVSAAACSKS
jgi:hypothetical protein